MQLRKAPRQFGSPRRIFVDGFMFFIREKFTCSSLYNIIDKQQDCLFNWQLAGHMYMFFMMLRIIVLFDTELKYPLQCTAEADCMMWPALQWETDDDKLL